MDKTPRVLVGYATAAGSTAGIAQRIAATLQESGNEVVCRPVGPDLDPTSFDALVLGSAVHNVSWLRPALDFLNTWPSGWDRPTWCFSVGGISPQGLATGRLTALELAWLQRGFPPALRVHQHKFFGGVIDMRGVPIWNRVLWRLMGGRPGDHRNWPAIEGWARQIATDVHPALTTSKRVPE